MQTMGSDAVDVPCAPCDPRIAALLSWADGMLEHIDRVLATCELTVPTDCERP